MAVKSKTIFVCQNCGSQSPRWIGKCPNCENWNTYVEETTVPRVVPQSTRAQMAAAITAEVIPLSEVETIDEKRHLTGVGEFDRVMGGGVIPGSVTLIGGWTPDALTSFCAVAMSPLRLHSRPFVVTYHGLTGEIG